MTRRIIWGCKGREKLPSEFNKLREKYNSIIDQYNVHNKKYYDALSREDYYGAKNAIADMIDFHNETCKLNDQAKRRSGREFGVHISNLQKTVKSLREKAAKYELSYRQILDY